MPGLPRRRAADRSRLVLLMALLARVRAAASAAPNPVVRTAGASGGCQLERLLEMADAADIPEMTDAGRAIRSTIKRQARLIDDLFELSRTRAEKLRLNLDLVNLDDIVRDICTEAVLAAPERHLRVDIDRLRASLCMADPVRLEQIFSNLLPNAVKFSEVGGRIEVRVTSTDGFAEVSVSDDGCGISAEFLPKVFQMFGQERRTGHSMNPGLGIGLALVHKLTAAHGGRVKARSNGLGCGAQFTILLPLADVELLPSSMSWENSPVHLAVPPFGTARAGHDREPG